MFHKSVAGDVRWHLELLGCSSSQLNKGRIEGEVCKHEDKLASQEHFSYRPPPFGTETTEPLPVMVWIYGGGFLFGLAHSSYYGPDFLLAENVVVVDFNYRLNVFGFLSTSDTASPGNYGLKDQLLALKWVKANIASFGGDPETITIFGESAGAASVQHHVMSPKSRGLFQRAIAESGSVLCPWAFQKEPLKIALQVGVLSGVPISNTEELVNRLRGLPAERLRKAAMQTALLNTFNIIRSLPFSPTIEPDHENAFITSGSYETLLRGDFSKVPFLMGYNSQESAGVQPVLEPMELPLHWFSSLTNLEGLVPSDMNVEPEEIKKVTQKIRNCYFGKEVPNFTQRYVDFISDSYFYRPILRSATIHSNYSPVFLYKFSYQGFAGKKAFHQEENDRIQGVMHAEEMWYIFARSDLPLNATDKIISRRMARMWANFAKFGNPTPENDTLLQNIVWPTVVSSKDRPYLDIDHNLAVRRNDKLNMMEFWKGLYEKYGHPPFNTF